MFIVIDNLDTFASNIAMYLEELDAEVAVIRKDALNLEMLEKLKPQGIIISPGAGICLDSDINMRVIERFKGEIPILGIGLGHQVIASFFGGKIIQAKEPVHGKVSPISHDQKGLFSGLKNPLNVTRYHSLIVEDKLPDNLEVTARSSDDVIMGIRHRDYKIEGLQFSLEAYLTECGHNLLQNFIKICE